MCLFIGVFWIEIKTSYGLDFQSSRTLSLAGSGRGGALLTDTITLNPAFLGFQPLAALSGTLGWLKNPALPSGATTRPFNVSVIDGKNEYMEAGISFTRAPSVDFIHLALAKQVLPWLSFGVSGKRFGTRSNTLAASGQSANGFDGGLSAAIVISKETFSFPVQIGITSDNLNHSTAAESYLGPRQVGGGIKVNAYNIILLYGDFVENFSHFQGTFPHYSAGVELAIWNDFFLRGGLSGYDEKRWGAGAGWVGPKIGFSYGFQKKTLPDTGEYQHAATIEIYM